MDLYMEQEGVSQSIAQMEGAKFLLQAFIPGQPEIKKIKKDQDMNLIEGEILVPLELSEKAKLDIQYKNRKFEKKLNSIYWDFSNELSQLSETNFFILIKLEDVEEYGEEVNEEVNEENFFDWAKEELENLFQQKKIVYLPDNLEDLVGNMQPSGALAVNSITKLQVFKKQIEAYQFLEEAPKDIGLAFLATATILGIQAYLWLQVSLSLNTYMYTRTYSSFFWTYGILLILFSLIILVLFVPLFFCIRSGILNLIRWLRVTREMKKIEK